MNELHLRKFEGKKYWEVKLSGYCNEVQDRIIAAIKAITEEGCSCGGTELSPPGEGDEGVIKPKRLEKKFPKLKMFQCCGMDIYSTSDEAVCKKCGKKPDFSEQYVADVKHDCCGNEVYFVTNNKDLKIVYCKDCRVPTDVEYSHKAGKILSLNNFNARGSVI